MDAFGPREALFEIAKKLQFHDFNVFIPNLFYRFGDYKPFDPATAFGPGPDRDRIMGMIYSLDIPSVMKETALFLDYLENNEHLSIQKIGSLGYCMGGKFAIAVASYFPAQVHAAASIHGGSLVTKKPDSPHLLIHGIKAEVYLAIASNDRSFPIEHKQIMEDAFTAAKVKATLEIYPDGLHGFAIKDSLVYNPSAAEKHWQRILSLFDSKLK
jgi:carboxymethylenebutenolidase